MSTRITRRSISKSARRAAVASFLALVIAATGAVTNASAVAADVSGFTFRDFNSNGVYDTGNAAGSGLANDVPLGGVLVTAYDAANAQVGTAVTAADGTYTLGVTGAFSNNLRVEFTFATAQQAEGYKSSYHGSGSGTSVQFVSIGAQNVNFGANVPEDYIQASPQVAVAINRPGDSAAVTGSAASLSSVASVDWEQNGTSTSTVGIQADFRDTGAVYGLAFQKGTTNLFASAVLRRHIGLGAAGLGGIYLVNTVTHSSTLWLDLDDGVVGGVDVGEAQFSADLASASGSTDNEKRGLTSDPANPSRDPVAFENVGKMGIGGIAISTDQKTLYAINLHTNTLISINIATKAVSESSLSLGQNVRPWGITVHRGQIYVGLVDTAEGGARADLRASVISAPESAPGTWTAALAPVSLDFARGSSSSSPGADLSGDVATHWNPWTEDFAAAEGQSFYSSTWVTNPQPILSSITFDVNGNLVMGFLDRFSFQSGMLNYTPTGSDTTVYSGISAGGMYGASPAGAGTFTFESNGTLGGVAGGGVADGEGPGGGRYYLGNNYNFTTSSRGSHSNALTGAVSAIPGYSNILSTGFDLNGAWTSEAGWIPISGAQYSLSQRILRNSANDNGADPNQETTTGLGKAGGLGAVTILAKLAPVEIGNRVWFDADQNGVQDADEPSVSGVTVSLTDASGNQVSDANGNTLGDVVTGANGEYYFSNLNPNTQYVVHFILPTTGNLFTSDPVFGTVGWSSVSFTTSTVGGSRSIDSNADVHGIAPVLVGGPGVNDHTIDAGLVANAPFTVEKLIDSNGGPAAPGQTFTMDFAGKDFRGSVYTVSPDSVTIGANETSAAITVPVGTRVKLTERADSSVLGVSYGGAAPDSDGYFRVADTSAPLALTVTNTLTTPPVTPPVTPSAPPPLAFTGADFPLLQMIVMVLSLFAAGIVLMVVARRRRRRLLKR